MAGELKISFPVARPETEEAEGVLLEMTIRKATKGTPGQIILCFARLEEDEELTRTTPIKNLVIADTLEQPTATLLRAALFSAVMTGPYAERMGVAGLTVREAGVKVLEQAQANDGE